MDKQWFPTTYKLFDAELESIVDDWPTAWRELINLEEVWTSPPVDALIDHVPNQQSDHESDEALMRTLTDSEAERLFE